MPTYSFVDLDDERCLPGANASALVPLRCLANQRYLRENRHVGTGVKCSATPFSTHPKAWWGFPQLVPVYRGAQTLKVQLAVEANNEDGLVRLECNGIVSSPTTVTAGAGIQWITLSVALTGAGGNDAIATVQFQSGIDTTSGTSVTVNASSTTDDNEVSVSGLTPPQAMHKCMVFTTTTDANQSDLDQWHEGYRYIGGQGVFGYRVWPRIETTQWIANGSTSPKPTAYDLTTFELHGFTWWVEGDEVGDLVPEAPMRPLEPIYAQSLQRLHSTTRDILRTRTWIAQCQVGIGSAGNSAVALTSPGGTPKVGAAYQFNRTETSGYRAVGITVSLSGDVDTAWQDADTTTSTVDAPFVELADDVAGPDQAGAGGILARRDIDYPGTLAYFGTVLNASGWGGRDLIHCAPGESDVARMQVVRADIAAGAVTGSGLIAFRLGNLAPIWSPQIREIREVTRQLDGPTAILPGEVVRGNTEPTDSGPEGPGRLAIDIRRARSYCQRMLLNMPIPSAVESGGTGDTQTFYGIAPFRLSPDSSRILFMRINGMNIAAHVGIYDTSDTLLTTIDLTVGTSNNFDDTFSLDDLSGTLSSDTTYYIKITGEANSAPGGTVQTGQVGAFMVYEAAF